MRRTIKDLQNSWYPITINGNYDTMYSPDYSYRTYFRNVIYLAKRGCIKVEKRFEGQGKNNYYIIKIYKRKLRKLLTALEKEDDKL